MKDDDEGLEQIPARVLGGAESRGIMDTSRFLGSELDVLHFVCEDQDSTCELALFLPWRWGQPHRRQSTNCYPVFRSDVMHAVSHLPRDQQEPEWCSHP